MRYRKTAVETTGEEPELTEEVLAGFRPADTVVGGTAWCTPCLVECTPMQRMSSLSAPNGAPLLMRGR
jgi:hypothetical protein